MDDKKLESVEETETKDVDISTVEKAVEEAVTHSKKVEAENAELKNVADNKAKELDAIKADLEDLKAKASAPAIITSQKDTKEMESREQFKTFLIEGEEGLRRKGTSLNISTNDEGGYALPEELRTEIIALEKEVSPIRQVASVASAATTDVKQLVSIGSAASGWVGEQSSRPVTNSPELAQRTATFGEVYANPQVYAHMLEDAFFNVESWLTGEVARQFAEQEGIAFLSGDGSNKPVGMLNGLTLNSDGAANDTTGAYQVLNSGVNNALGSNDSGTIEFLRSVVKSLKTGYLAGSSWMMNRATHNSLLNLKDGDSNYYMQRDITNAGATQLFGYPIVINEDMADINEAAHSAPIMFGDFARAFQIVDRVGVSILRNPYTNLGSVLFYTRKRVGSMVLDASALKVVGVSHA